MANELADYRITVTRDAHGPEFIATVSEFPSLSWIESTANGAKRGMRSLLREVVADMAASGEPIPAPGVVPVRRFIAAHS
jgi:hypothetical protein